MGEPEEAGAVLIDWDDVAREVDAALYARLGPNLMATSWVLVASVMDDDGRHDPTIVHSPDATWVECFGLLDAAGMVLRSDYLRALAESDAAGEDDD